MTYLWLSCDWLYMDRFQNIHNGKKCHGIRSTKYMYNLLSYSLTFHQPIMVLAVTVSHQLIPVGIRALHGVLN